MIANQSEYDTGVNTFSPEGRIYQIEYAMNASKLGASGIGLVCKEGVVFAVEKKSSSKLVEKIGFEKISEIDSHLFCVVSGLISDSRTLIESGRSEAHYHRFIYKEDIPIKALSQSVADLALNFGEGDITTKRKPIARPYGVSLLFGGIDSKGPCIYQTDPSGTLIGFLAKGVGSAEEGIQVLLDKHFKKDLTVDQGELMAISMLKQVMEEKIRCDNVELVSIRDKIKGFERKDQKYVEDLLKRTLDLNQ